MLRHVAEINWSNVDDGRFVTVTYPDNLAGHTMKQRCVHRYRLVRDIEKIQGQHTAVAWRVEWVTRKSGKLIGTIQPHMHMLVFGGSRIRKPWLMQRWAKAIGHQGFVSVDCQEMDGSEMAAVYVAKYCAKVSDATILDNVPYLNKTGRHAGWMRKRLIPKFPIEKIPVESFRLALEIEKRAWQLIGQDNDNVGNGITIMGAPALALWGECLELGIDELEMFQ